MIRLALKYNREWSKNAVCFSKNTGRYFYNNDKKTLKNEVFWILKGAKIDKEQGVNIFLSLHRNAKRADPQNLVDIFSDAISDGLGIDDKYFTILSTACDSCKPKESWVEVVISQCNIQYSRILTKTLIDGSQACDLIASSSNWTYAY